jgi:hypothetical protein
MMVEGFILVKVGSYGYGIGRRWRMVCPQEEDGLGVGGKQISYGIGAVSRYGMGCVE